MVDADSVVRLMLSEARLPASEEELDALAKVYPRLKREIESLYAVTEARYELPALTFTPDPTFGDWERDRESE
jgi:hypothetical protein